MNSIGILALLLVLLVQIATSTASSSSCTSSSYPRTLFPITAFASSPQKGNKKNKKTTNIVGTGGFGKSNQPKLEELEFPNRIPNNASDTPCPCGSGTTTHQLLYKDCCSPFHSGQKLPQSPLEVLKTRYTAFAWRMPQYVIETTHPVCKDFRKDKLKWARDLNRSGMFDSYDFVKLDVVGEETFNPDNDGEGFIEFKVNLKANKNSGEHIEGQDIVVEEKSRFLRTSDGGWKYAGGDVTSNVAGLEGIKLN